MKYLSRIRCLSSSHENTTFENTSFDDLWESLSPREQSEVLRLLIDKVEYDAVHEKMSLQFHPSSYAAVGQEGVA